LSSFSLTLKQQWTIEGIYIFSNSSHLERCAGMSDTILKGTHPRTIPVRFDLDRYRGFREQYLNVKAYDIRRVDWRMHGRLRTTDAKWWQKITWYLPRLANKRFCSIISLNFSFKRPHICGCRIKTAWF
jgi:hypothetical protein